MSWTTDDIPDLGGRVAVVTGGNGGLGLASVTALAGAGAHVVMAARDQAKAETGRTHVLASHPDASLEVVELDLGSLASVEAAATTIAATHDRLDVLMNNAGVMAMPEGTTADGFETQWGVNVLGHWALTAHLLPLLVRTRGARVVWLTSVAQHQALGLRDDPQMRDDYDPWAVYSQTKLANRLLAEGLQRRFEAAGLHAMSLVAHPGLTNSDLQTRTNQAGGGGSLGRASELVARRFGMTTERGALSQLRAATDPGADPRLLYGPALGAVGAPVGKPMVRPGTTADAERLFAMAERETGLSLDVAAALDG